MADKAEVERALDEAWSELITLVQAVPEDDATQPGVVEDWSLKDLLGHMAFWSGRACRTLRCVGAGHPEEAEFGEGPAWVDEWNAREMNARKQHSWSEVRAEWMRNHEEAAKALDEAPADKLDGKLKDQYAVLDVFAEDTYKHYREHAEHIRNWLRQTETSEE